MVGGGTDTKSVFRISGGPMSLPSFIADVGHEIGHFVNAQTLAYASGEPADYPLVSVEGSRNPQLAIMEGINLGSDHEVFNEGSFQIPGIYLHDWPDRYIHTNFDVAGNIDPTKLKRAAFIAALQAYYLASLTVDDIEPLTALLRANALQRARQHRLQLADLQPADRSAVSAVQWQVERQKVMSIGRFVPLPRDHVDAIAAEYAALERILAPAESSSSAAISAPNDGRVFRRNPQLLGPMSAFGYSFLEAHTDAEDLAAVALTPLKAYEALNLVDGQRDVGEIRHWLVAELGDVPLPAISQYLSVLERIGVIEQVASP
jgi:hypothetical protein